MSGTDNKPADRICSVVLQGCVGKGLAVQAAMAFRGNTGGRGPARSTKLRAGSSAERKFFKPFLFDTNSLRSLWHSIRSVWAEAQTYRGQSYRALPFKDRALPLGPEVQVVVATHSPI